MPIRFTAACHFHHALNVRLQLDFNWKKYLRNNNNSVSVHCYISVRSKFC